MMDSGLSFDYKPAIFNGEVVCPKCRMRFPTSHQLEVHSQRFCNNSASGFASFQSRLSAEDIKDYIRDPRNPKSAGIGGLSLACIRDNLVCSTLSDLQVKVFQSSCSTLSDLRETMALPLRLHQYAVSFVPLHFGKVESLRS